MAFITIDGENKIALQQGNSQLINITHFVLANIAGLGSEPADRIEAMSDPGDIVDTRPVTKSGYVNTNQVVYSLTLDSTIGDYTFNWIGLKDEDDTLIGVIYLADPITKTATNGGTEGNNLVRNFLLKYSGIQATTAISAPAETWQIDFTLRLLQIDERERLSNLDIYGHDAFFDGGFDVTLDAGTVYNVSAGVGYVGGIRCAFDSTQQIDVGSVPNGIWIDASLQGDLTGKDADVQLVASATPLVDYQDVNGINHYVAKLCDLSGGGLVTDTKTSTDLVTDHEGKPDPHPQYLTQAEADALYEPDGSVAAHEGKTDPHPQYLTENEADLIYEPIGEAVAKGIGYGQTWQDVEASRSAGVTYTNTTAKPIQASIAVASSSSSGSGTYNFYVDGVVVDGNSWSNTSWRSSLNYVIPNGSTYKISGSGTFSLTGWAELR